MKYMLLIYGNDEIWSSFTPEQMDALVRDTDAHNAALFASGELVGAYGVADDLNAKVVRSRNGAMVVSDGPYMEAKECIGSFSIVDCESLERALEIAAAMPSAHHRQIEVRPLMHEAATDA